MVCMPLENYTFEGQADEEMMVNHRYVLSCMLVTKYNSRVVFKLVTD